MALKETLFENKKINEQIKFAVAEKQSRLSYELGYHDSKTEMIDFADLYNPLVKQYADIQLKLQNGTSKNPVADRKYVDKINGSVQIIKTGVENIIGNVEAWGEMVQKGGLMGGVDLMGTPVSRFLTLTILKGDLSGKTKIQAVDDDLNKLAFEIYEKDGKLVERIYLNKLNELSLTQDMFISIPNTFQQNENFKLSSPEIFETQELGGEAENRVLTGGVTEIYRKKKADGELEIKTKDLDGNMVQDFYIIDKETIGESLQFITEIDKITAGMLGAYESSDPVIAFNNNILSEVTDHYIKPGKALREKEQLKFQEDYKKWYLEKEIGKEFPLGTPRLKNQEIVEEAEEVVEQEQVV
jgi:hypothetical protein